MPNWADILSTVRLRLSTEWVYDQYSSSLTTLWFDNWQIPEQHLVVAITPPVVDARADDDEWLRRTGSRDDQTGTDAGTDEWLSLRSPAGWAVMRRAMASDEPYLVFIRCVGLDVRIGYFNVRSEAAALAVLSPLVASLEIPACSHDGEVPDYAGDLELIACAGRAVVTGADDASALVDEVKNSLIAGWHYSLITPGRPPEVPAAVYLAGILVRLGDGSSDLLALRDADLMAQRASRTLQDSSGMLIPAAISRLEGDIADVLSQVRSAQWRVLDPKGAVNDADRPRRLVRLRGTRSVEQAVRCLDAAALTACCDSSDAAAEDLLYEIWQQRRAYMLSEDADGAEPPDTGPPSARDRMAVLVPALFAEFDACQFLQRESEMRRASELMLAGCRFLGESDDHARRTLTRAILGRVHGLTIFADGPALAQSRELLREAEGLLERTEDAELSKLAAVERERVQHLEALERGADDDG